MSSSSKAEIFFKRDLSRSSTIPKDFRASAYHPYVNHAACLEHRFWWREPAMLWGAFVASSLAVISLSSAFLFGAGLDSKPEAQIAPSSIARLFDARSLSYEQRFCALCHEGENLIRAGETARGLNIVGSAETIRGVSHDVKAAMYNDIAIALHGAGRQMESISYLKKAIQADPHLLVAHNNLAMVMMDLGQTDKAAAALQDASKLHPFNVGIANQLSKLRSSI